MRENDTVKNMEELISEICENEAGRDFLLLRNGPVLGRLSDLGISRSLELMKKYGHVDQEALCRMVPEDQDDLLRIRCITHNMPYFADDPFARREERI